MKWNCSKAALGWIIMRMCTIYSYLNHTLWWFHGCVFNSEVETQSLASVHFGQLSSTVLLVSPGLPWGQRGVWSPSSTVEVQHSQAWPCAPVPHHCHWLHTYALCGCCWSGGVAESKWHETFALCWCLIYHRKFPNPCGRTCCTHVHTYTNTHWTELRTE